MDVDDEGDYLDDDGMMAVSMLHLVVRGLDETVASRFAEVCHQPSLGSLLYDVCSLAYKDISKGSFIHFYPLFYHHLKVNPFCGEITENVQNSFDRQIYLILDTTYLMNACTHLLMMNIAKKLK